MGELSNFALNGLWHDNLFRRTIGRTDLEKLPVGIDRRDKWYISDSFHKDSCIQKNPAISNFKFRQGDDFHFQSISWLRNHDTNLTSSDAQAIFDVMYATNESVIVFRRNLKKRLQISLLEIVWSLFTKRKNHREVNCKRIFCKQGEHAWKINVKKYRKLRYS